MKVSGWPDLAAKLVIHGTVSAALFLWQGRGYGGTDKKGIVQERCASRGGRPGMSVLTSLMVSVDVKQY